MAVRVAINGFGRIGRGVFRIAVDRKDIEFVALNDVTENETLAYLLRYDTVHGLFPHPVKLEDGELVTGAQRMKMLTESDPAKLPWKEFNVDVVIESTGRFRSRAEVEKHVQAGAKRVILTVPPKDALDAMVVLGVNDHILRPEHKLVSNASCTTNCLAPIVKVLHDAFGLERGFMTTVHAYTNDQHLSDVFHKDFRRARAANENIIPTTTGAAKAVGKILPELSGKLDGMSMRVPIPDGSITDFVAVLKRNVAVAEINDAVRNAADGPMKGIVQYSTEPIVSSDIIGNSHSAIFDAPFTKVLRGNFVKTVSWYDNEWGYSSRCVDLIMRLAAL
ncbi:MAG TPA: type I glyceraldehyde-3-phosphate dehydrogenase [Bdellovibrionota bacterium]|nr:type I glyceraldehyde-3-phosphate dehydrogenase [Bdellovibrionota bacterium]